MLQDHIIPGTVGLEVVPNDLTRCRRADLRPGWRCNIHPSVMPSRLARDRIDPTTHSRTQPPRNRQHRAFTARDFVNMAGASSDPEIVTDPVARALNTRKCRRDPRVIALLDMVN